MASCAFKYDIIQREYSTLCWLNIKLSVFHAYIMPLYKITNWVNELVTIYTILNITCQSTKWCYGRAYMKQIYNARRTNMQRNMNPLSIRKTNIIAQSLIVATSVLDSSLLIIASQLRLSITLLMLKITVYKMLDHRGVGLLGCRLFIYTRP
jgi:hypothetical protein